MTQNIDNGVNGS